MEEDYTKTLQDLCKKVDQISDSSNTQATNIVVPGAKRTFPSFLNMQTVMIATVPIAIAIIFVLWRPTFITYEDKSSETGETTVRLRYIRLLTVTVVLSAVVFAVLFVVRHRRRKVSTTESTPELSVPDKNAL